MKNSVQLTTTGLTQPLSITAFQFGTVPAPDGSSQLLKTTVPAGLTAVEIFSLQRNINIPSGEFVRYNIQFQVNTNNAANLQIRLAGAGTSTDMLWRWSAPIGYVGTWSKAEQQAPWYDHHVDYAIHIAPSDVGILVSLSERPGTPSSQLPFIPAEQAQKEMLRPV